MLDLKKFAKIHYSHMVDPPTNNPIYEEMRTFRRELPRLLAEGCEGKWALIKGTEVVGLFDTFDEGYISGRQQFHFQPFVVGPVSEWQPFVRTRG